MHQYKCQQDYQYHQVMFYLGVAYAANIGGTGTLTASEPNVIMKGILDEKFPCQVEILYGAQTKGMLDKKLPIRHLDIILEPTFVTDTREGK